MKFYIVVILFISSLGLNIWQYNHSQTPDEQQSAQECLEDFNSLMDSFNSVRNQLSDVQGIPRKPNLPHATETKRR